MQDFKAFLSTSFAASLIAIASAAFAAAVAFLIYKVSTRRKALSYTLVSNTTLLAIDAEVAGRIEVLFDGVKTQNLGLILIAMENTGNEPIRKEDFERPFTIRFPQIVEIISAEVIDCDPPGLVGRHEGLSIGVNRCEVAPCLLNPRDSLTIKLLVREHSGEVEIDARIAGVRQLSRRAKGLTGNQMVTRFAVTLLGSIAISAAAMYFIMNAFLTRPLGLKSDAVMALFGSAGWWAIVTVLRRSSDT